MTRNRTGLRNRYRDGQSPYYRKGKASRRDTYGSYSNGYNTRGEVIDGRHVGSLTHP